MVILSKNKRLTEANATDSNDEVQLLSLKMFTVLSENCIKYILLKYIITCIFNQLISPHLFNFYYLQGAVTFMHDTVVVVIYSTCFQ